MVLVYIPPALFKNVPQLNLFVDDRERYERHVNPTFSSPSGANRSDLYTRLRIGLEYVASPLWTANVTYQNSSDVYWTQNLNASTDNSDLYKGYVKYTSSNLTAIAGRQELSLGKERLIGPTPWLNLGRTFDAGYAKSGQWDAWGGKIAVANTRPETARVDGITHADKTWGTTSLIYKHDLGTKSGIDEDTLDHFVSHKFGKLTVEAEGAVQYGSNNGLDQRAWAYHVGVSEHVLPKTTLSIEGNSASGGSNATTNRTFDNLYPSNHDLYGLADLVGWKNMNELALKLENHTTKSLTLKAEAHSFSLRDASTAWYSATGVVNTGPGGPLVDPTGGSGGDLGREYDLSATWSLKNTGSFSAGIAFFEPGNFVGHLYGNSNQLTFGFLQYQTRF